MIILIIWMRITAYYLIWSTHTWSTHIFGSKNFKRLSSLTVRAYEFELHASNELISIFENLSFCNFHSVTSITPLQYSIVGITLSSSFLIRIQLNPLRICIDNDKTNTKCTGVTPKSNTAPTGPTLSVPTMTPLPTCMSTFSISIELINYLIELGIGQAASGSSTSDPFSHSLSQTRQYFGKCADPAAPSPSEESEVNAAVVDTGFTGIMMYNI